MGPRRSALLVLAVLSALALCCAAPALALEPAGAGWYWQSPQPQGQMLNDVAFGDALNAWAVGDAGTIMHSGDAGTTWQRQSAPTSQPLGSVVFIDALHGWAAGGRNWDDDEVSSQYSGIILATTDGGATWVVQKDLKTDAIADLAFVGTLEGWAVGSRGLLLHTTDGGQTWARQSVGVARNLLSVAFKDATHGWIGGARGILLRTADGGVTWTRKKSAYDGMWTDVSSLLAGPDGAVWAGLGSKSMSGSYGRLARSGDGGRTWRLVRGVGTTYGVRGLAADGEHVLAVGPLQEFIASAGRNAVSRVLVAGADGASLDPHIIGASATLASIASNGAGVLCAVGDITVTSSDGGETWQGRSTHVLGVSDLDMVSATEGWASGGPTSLGRLLFDDPSQVDGGVYHTADGVRWEEQLHQQGLLYAVDFADASNGWTVGDEGLIKHTSDGGATWSDQSVVTRGTLFYVHAASAADAWAGGLEVRKNREPATVLLRTTDAGGTWSTVPVPSDFFAYAMDFGSASEGWLTGFTFDAAAGTVTPEVLRTVDGGTIWQTQTLASVLSQNALPLAVDFVDGQHGWIASLDESDGSPTILATSDGGDTWTVVANAAAFDGGYIVTLEFVSPLEGWASGDALYHTTDGGVTWTRQVPGVAGGLLAIAAADPTHVWAGGSGLLSTVDAQGDTAGPVTLSDIAGGWTRRAVAIHLSAADVGGSGVSSTEYRVDGGAWTPGLLPPEFPAPADHSGDGSHVVDYRSTDGAGNVEITQVVHVDIDTVRPLVRLGRCTVGRDNVLRLRLRIDDASCRSVDRFALKVRDRKGGSVASWSSWGADLPTNKWFTRRDSDWGWLEAGKYRIDVKVWDRAGNKPRPGTGTLVVLGRRGEAGSGLASAAAPHIVRHTVAPEAAAFRAGLPAALRMLLRRLGRAD